MKRDTKADYINSVCKAVLYIEQNYNDNITLEELSKVASFSKYHFHRVFKSIIGENVGDYIRRVRLQRTTLKFKTNQKVTQIALESGYETSASFSKAFKLHFGITPKEFSKKAKERKGIRELKPKFVELKTESIFYVRKTGQYLKSCKEAWKILSDFVINNNISNKVIIKIGIGHDDPNVTKTEKLRCDACVVINDTGVRPSGEVLLKTLDGGKYAMFLHVGAYEELQSVYDEIGDWIVESKVKLRDLPTFEKYLDMNPKKIKSENLRTEVYVPIF